MFRHVLLLILAVSACASSQTKRRVDGTYAINCRSQKACLDHAANLCGDGGYNIVGGRHNQKKYGVPGNEKVVGRDEIFIRCTKDKLDDAPDPAAGSWKLERNDGGMTPSSKKEAGRQACRPGETQRCVGAGACDGGQVCLTDGSGFGACDCGSQSQNHATSTDAGVE